jgi:hypothetical protein
MRRVVHFFLTGFEYAFYAVGALISLYAFIGIVVFLEMVIGEALLGPGYTAKHMSKDQSCQMYPPAKGCPDDSPLTILVIAAIGATLIILILRRIATRTKTPTSAASEHGEVEG